MVSTDRLKADLTARGFSNTLRWRRGVDVDMFTPDDKEPLPGPGPILMYVGRVAVEKNIEAFLDLDVAGTKVVVGEGPQRKALQAAYPDVRFPGLLQGQELARHYAAADVFVFPSLTDTFGLVMLEALASGVPVAAFPVAGPLDVILDPAVGALSHDLGQAVKRALTLDPTACRAYALQYSWQAVARSFVNNLAPIPGHRVPGRRCVAAA
jgi:glycosyltransferase involved in cell wall biosynthesis